jgi:Ras-related protein Rab-8A
VTFEQGKKLADEHGMKFYEVSAKTNLNIENIFLSTTAEVLENPTWQKRNEENVLKMKLAGKPAEKKKCC